MQSAFDRKKTDGINSEMGTLTGITVGSSPHTQSNTPYLNNCP
jgi:hypothetical protein